MGYIMMPRFQLAFRRALFYLILLVLYLVAGAVLFLVLWNQNVEVQGITGRSEKLDFERTELLNVLYSEAIGRQGRFAKCDYRKLPEHDWILLANQKMDAFERSLNERFEAGLLLAPTRKKIAFTGALRHAFNLITTIGPADVDDLNPPVKVFSIVYAFFGIPLVLLYLAQCTRAITSALSDWKVILFTVAAFVALVAAVYDVTEDDEEDEPFLDAVFAVFLSMSTIGAHDSKDSLPPFIVYVASLVGLALFTVGVQVVQERLERVCAPYELSFTHEYAKMERALSGNCLEVLQEESEDKTEAY